MMSFRFAIARRAGWLRAIDLYDTEEVAVFECDVLGDVGDVRNGKVQKPWEKVAEVMASTLPIDGVSQYL